MDEIKSMLIKMQEDMREQKAEMLNMKEDIKNNINNNINEKFKSLEVKYSVLEQIQEIHKKAIDNFEREKRKKNLIFFGVEETENNYLELEEKMLNIINNKLNIRCDITGIEYVRRLGKKGEKVRPIVVTLLTMGIKINILKNKKRLEKYPYYIKEDFPLEILKKRKELQKELQKAREEGKQGFIKYDKLIILENRADQQQRTNKKRNLSESPQTSSNYTVKDKQHKKQPTKINKTNNMNNFIIKKSMSLHPEKNSSYEQNSTYNQTETGMG